MSAKISGLEQAFSAAGLAAEESVTDNPEDVGIQEAGQSRQPCRANNQVTADYDNNGGIRDLVNAQSPNFVLQKESPEHRFLLYLFAQGNSVIEVFSQLGGQVDPKTKLPIPGTGRYSYGWLCQIRRQAWFRRQLTEFLHETGKDLVQAKLQTELVPSLEAVIEIRDDMDAPASVRLNAANSLIDRYLGKPVQHVRTESASSTEKYEAEAADLQRQIEQVDQEMKSLNAATQPMLQS